ncbi:phage/plasmid primase, P4 family [Desulfitobacterium sp. PCE1]|uniref:DNA primase family protein n=1 Tax=Desulfitobacterium sp. PCE1 TaxID=146907 RepID=UPI00037E1D12|nr:phage/plasmid primase, P4 family [Desulfitobacterium sp. PCE1]
MAKRELTVEKARKAELESKFFSEDANGNEVFDVEKSTRYTLDIYDIVHNPKQGYFLFNEKYWKKVDDNYLAQLISKEMDLISKPYYTDQILKQISHKQYIKLEEINSDRKSIVLQNGTLNISDWKNPVFYENEFFREDFCTIYLDYPYDVNANCPNFSKYLSSTFESNPENIKTVQEMFGYCLTPSTMHEKIFLLYGEGGSGKSVLIDTLKTLVTDANYASVPMSLLDKSFLRAGLKDKILNFSTEECSRLVKDTAITWLKAISSGDPIEAQFKNKDTFNFKPFCKLVFAMNDLPQIENFDDALHRRFVIIQFNKKFRGDEIDLDLKEGKLHNEMAGILQFAIKGLMRLAEQRDFTYSQESKDMLNQYRFDSNNAERFAHYYLDVAKSSESYLKVNDVYEKYIEFCKENTEQNMKNAEFKKIIKRKFNLPQARKQKKIKGNPEEVYEGLEYKKGLSLVG